MRDKMEKKGEGKYGMSNKDYQPSKKQFAGDMMGNANRYMERTDRRMDKEASKLKSQAYKGRYD